MNADLREVRLAEYLDSSDVSQLRTFLVLQVQANEQGAHKLVEN